MNQFDTVWHNSETNFIFNESFKDQFDSVTIYVEFHFLKNFDQICPCTRGSWLGTKRRCLTWHLGIVNGETWQMD